MNKGQKQAILAKGFLNGANSIQLYKYIAAVESVKIGPGYGIRTYQQRAKKILIRLYKLCTRKDLLQKVRETTPSHMFDNSYSKKQLINILIDNPRFKRDLVMAVHSVYRKQRMINK